MPKTDRRVGRILPTGCPPNTREGAKAIGRKMARKAAGKLTLDLDVSEAAEQDYHAKVQKASDIVAETLSKMFGETEGDPNFEFTLIDRTRFHRSHYLPVPYYHTGHGDFSPRALEQSLEVALLNLKIATDEVFRISSILQSERLKETKGDK